MPWLLRTPAGEIPIDRACVIGRSAECEAPIDDPNASRRHAALRVVGRDLVVEDLASRNGTFVEGKLIGSPTTLSTTTRILIGHTVLTIVRAESVGTSTPAPVHRAGPAVPETAHTSTSVPDRAMLDRALAMLAADRVDECAGGASILVRRQSGMGPRALDEFVHGVSALLVALAQRTGDPRWLEGLFSMNADCDRMIQPELVDAIEAVAPRGRVHLLPAYVDKLSARAGTLTAAERMVFARIARLAG